MTADDLVVRLERPTPHMGREHSWEIVHGESKARLPGGISWALVAVHPHCSSLRRCSGQWPPLSLRKPPQALALPPLSSSDYRILPQYRVHSPLQGLIRKARQKEDDYPSEKYRAGDRKPFRALGGGASQKKNDCARLRHSFRLGSRRPRPSSGVSRNQRPPRPSDSRRVGARVFPRMLSLGRDAFLEEFRSSLGLISEFSSPSSKWRIWRSPLPLRSASRPQIRYTLVGTGPRAAPPGENRRVAD